MPLLSPARPARAVPFACALEGHGDAPALIDGDSVVSYRELAGRVAGQAELMAGEHRLMLLAGCPTAASITTYLAALATGTPVILTAAERPEVVEGLCRRYDPDIVAGPFRVGPTGAVATTSDWRWTERRARPAHGLHPELAVLLSTSGSTGSPKLVRLSHENVQSNAQAIADALDIRAGDRAATTLPLHYCYGLSVLHSHLLRGAALILTDRSVVDPAFWDMFRAAGGTTLAGVPHTFHLLDLVGFDRMHLPPLRIVTQAGGRLDPDVVARYARLAERDGWRFHVMYGQTEATARMAVLPAELAATRPGCIGVPIPGGAFRLAPLDTGDPAADPGVGELVYEGPNVMLGYAEGPADLAAGRSIDALHTGDLARRHPDGLFEIVGRRSRFVKIFGTRVDLERVEATLRSETGAAVWCAGDDTRLVIGVMGGATPDEMRDVAMRLTRLPRHVVEVRALTSMPMLPNGKPDLVALMDPPGGGAPVASAPGTVTAEALCAMFGEVLDRRDVRPDQSFVALGGDSLSFVEMSIRLDEAVGRLPDDWHLMPIRDLVPQGPVAPARHRRLDVSAAVRAVAIVLIVGTHAELFRVPGGAHLLIGACGFNFARFHLSGAARTERVAGIWRAVRRIALASMIWIGAVTLVLGDYGWPKTFLVHYFTAPRGTFNEFWFIETLVLTLLVVMAALAIPWVDRLERRHPFALPVVVMLAGLVTRYELHPGDRLATPFVVAWLFALGWAAARATRDRHRWLVTAAAIVTVPGFFEDPQREAVIVLGLVLLIWVRTMPSHAAVNWTVAALAGSSLYIYLTHWQVYQRLMDTSPLLATVASLVVGVAYAALARRTGALVTEARRRLTSRARGTATDPLAAAAAAAGDGHAP